MSLVWKGRLITQKKEWKSDLRKEDVDTALNNF